MEGQEFEFAYFKSVVQHFNHYPTGIYFTILTRIYYPVHHHFSFEAIVYKAMVISFKSFVIKTFMK